jgi:hypothetical protein
MATSWTDWPCIGEFVLIDTVKFHVPVAMDVRSLLLASVCVYIVCVELLVAADALYGKHVFVCEIQHRLMPRFPEGKLSVALVVSIGPCGRMKL